MKKILLGFLVAILVLATTVTYVDAATISADKTEVKAGDTVIVTVTLEGASRTMQFDMNYDATSYDFVDVSADNSTLAKSSNVSGGVVSAMFFDLTGSDSNVANSASFVFTAKENVKEATFSVNVIEPAAQAGVKGVTIKVEEAKEPDPVNPDPVNPDPVNPDPVNPDPVNPDPVNPDSVNPDPVNPDPVNPDPVNPGPVNPDPTPAAPSNPTTGTASPAISVPVASGSAMPTTLPQTGVPYVAIAFIILAVVTCVMVIVKKINQ